MPVWTPVAPATGTWLPTAIVLLDEAGSPISDTAGNVMGEG